MEPIVFIPGLLCTEILFAPQLGAFSDHPVMVADHRSHESIAAIAQAILAAAPERFSVVGLSMGGYIALELVRQAPGRISRLALLNTLARPDTPEQTEHRERLIALANDGKFDRVAPALFPKFVAPARTGDETLRETVEEMAHETGPQAFIRQQHAIIARIDQRPNLAAITCPTLVLAGEQDRLMPVEVVRELHEGIPASRFECLSGCGHLSTLEQPTDVIRILKDWITC
ncbi:alpha/beta fold hydrolase [Breoghania sp.]|uniref:alpha/beta fold hydrolase n=1 Tax=Breoghania sp. TaxID=2065378 RepID=UPI002AA7620B|nr:alpha/beta fold hydrolase [Breoghania sp.]